jgi:hypothetical protein
MTTGAGLRRFPILFTGANKAMVVIGLRPANSYVELSDSALTVRLGWGFSVHADRAAVASAAPDHGKVRGWGAHGWRGTWLVNGSSSNLVRVAFDPPGRGRVLGVPVTVRILRVSVEDPAALIAALAPT